MIVPNRNAKPPIGATPTAIQCDSLQVYSAQSISSDYQQWLDCAIARTAREDLVADALQRSHAASVRVQRRDAPVGAFAADVPHLNQMWSSRREIATAAVERNRIAKAARRMNRRRRSDRSAAVNGIGAAAALQAVALDRLCIDDCFQILCFRQSYG